MKRITCDTVTGEVTIICDSYTYDEDKELLQCTGILSIDVFNSSLLYQYDKLIIATAINVEVSDI